MSAEEDAHAKQVSIFVRRKGAFPRFLFSNAPLLIPLCF